MFCSKCGKEINNSVLCPFCGAISEENKASAINSAKGKPASTPQPPAQNLQNQAVNQGAYGNGFAGQNQAPQQPQYINNRPRPAVQQNGGKKDNSTVIILTVAIAVVVIVLVVAVLFMFNMFNQGKDNGGYDDGETIVETFEPEVTPTPEPTPVVKPASSYICVPGGGSWYDAQAAVINYGPNAHLVTFDSYEEFRFVCDHAKNNGLNSFWAGMQARSLTDWESGGLDVNGRPFDKNNLIWLTGEPSGYDYNLPVEERIFEDCLVVIYKDGSWVANDAPGTTDYTSAKAGYVIEIE